MYVVAVGNLVLKRALVKTSQAIMMTRTTMMTMTMTMTMTMMIIMQLKDSHAVKKMGSRVSVVQLVDGSRIKQKISLGILRMR